jgi:hypothetical protein
MTVVDPREDGLDEDAIRAVANREPWASWSDAHRVARLPEMPHAESVSDDELLTRQIMHGYTREDLTMMLRPAAAHGKDPAKLHIVCRGTYRVHDTPQGKDRRPLWGTLDEIREDIGRERSVMSLGVLLGPRAPLLGTTHRSLCSTSSRASSSGNGRPAGGWTRPGACIAERPASGSRSGGSAPRRWRRWPTASRSWW